MITHSLHLTRLKNWTTGIRQPVEDRSWQRARWEKWALYAIEWLIIVMVANLYAGQNLLNFDPQQLQQTGEHNESATLPLLAEIGVERYGEIPLWNPYMLTGFPHVGDFVNHFWNPVSTLPILVWGGINGMKVSIFISLVLAGLGQWLFGHVFGLRSLFRLWSALLFMLSGGLALLWRLGWYELLLGAAWFPWCFAVFWWALHRRDQVSVILATLCVTMVLTTGGGYYPLYLSVSLAVLLGMALLKGSKADRWAKIRRATAVALLNVALLAVMFLPMLDGYKYTARDAMPDLQQNFSQSIPYALINYLIAAPEWFGADILAKGSGWSWFYIGPLPFLALALTPLMYAQAPWRRRALLALAALTLVLLAWHANRFAPFKYIYNWIPFLYTFRFPNRLLIIVTSPLLVLAGLGLQHLLFVGRRWSRGWRVTIAQKTAVTNPKSISMRGVLTLALFIVMVLSLRDVYKVNKQFAFSLQYRNAKAETALRWLKTHDPDLYYTDLGGYAFFGDWMPAGYDLEMPIINFRYNRRLVSMDAQNQPGSPFFASAKYLMARPDQARPANAELLTEFDGVQLLYLPDALPFAFSTNLPRLQAANSLTNADVAPLSAHFSGPNQVVVQGQPANVGDHLVVLVSDYPGWRLLIDGLPAGLEPVNGYLGTAMRSGEHTYTFIFHPTKYDIGLVISLLTLVGIGGVLLLSLVRRLSATRSTRREVG